MPRTSHILLVSSCLLALATVAGEASAGAVAYELRKFPGIPVHVVTVDLSCPAITVEAQLASGGPGTVEPFRSMLRRTRPVAAITGAFFDTRSKYPVGDIAVNGKVVHRGIVGDGICVTQTGQVKLVPREDGVRCGWTGYTTVLCGGPTLLRDGKLELNPKAQGFRDSGLYGSSRRTAVGLTKNNKLLLVSINKAVSLKRLALIMQELGCQDALTLDGGSSAGLWFDGKILSSPGRKLTNLLAVHYDKPSHYIASVSPGQP